MILTQAKVKAATGTYVVILLFCQKIFILFLINFGLNRGMASLCPIHGMGPNYLWMMIFPKLCNSNNS